MSEAFETPAMGAATARLGEEMRRATAEIQAADRAARGMAAAVGAGLRRSLDQAVFGAGRLSDVLRGLALDVARGGLRAATAPLGEAVARGVTGLVAGLAGGVRAFAKGGVVSGPVAFPMQGGLGVAGEAGPEAILPLARGSDGRLGVRGGGPVQVTMHVATPDAEGFRRSAPQLAAALARAVERGRRNL